jgi:hypothetical protein
LLPDAANDVKSTSEGSRYSLLAGVPPRFAVRKLETVVMESPEVSVLNWLVAFVQPVPQ